MVQGDVQLIKASSSTNGRMTKVAATATPGTALHTVTANSGEYEVLAIYAVNTDTVARDLTIELGGTTSPDDLVVKTMQPKEGLVVVVPRATLTGGVVIRAFAATANVINCKVEPLLMETE